MTPITIDKYLVQKPLQLAYYNAIELLGKKPRSQKFMDFIDDLRELIDELIQIDIDGGAK